LKTEKLVKIEFLNFFISIFSKYCKKNIGIFAKIMIIALVTFFGGFSKATYRLRNLSKTNFVIFFLEKSIINKCFEKKINFPKKKTAQKSNVRTKPQNLIKFYNYDQPILTLFD